MEENSRLADLTRMLLSSPHFSSFLNDLSVNGPPAQLLQPPSTQPPAPAEIANDSKAAQVAQDVQLSNPQTVLPPLVEDEFDFASFESGFNSGIDPNFSNPTILAVMEVPEGPSIDTAALSGKSSFSTGSVTSDLPKELCPSFSHSLIQITPLESSSQETCGFQTADVDENDPSFTLYLDQPKEEPNSPFANVCSGPPSEKVTARFDLVVDADAAGPNRVDLIALRQFQRFRASIESSYERVCRATSHLG